MGDFDMDVDMETDEVPVFGKGPTESNSASFGSIFTFRSNNLDSVSSHSTKSLKRQKSKTSLDEVKEKKSALGNTATPSSVPSKTLAKASPRKVLQAKRKLQSPSKQTPKIVSSDIKNFYVIDTNILLSHFMSLKLLLSKLSDRSTASVKFIVPSTVLSELDGLKKDKIKEKDVKRIIGFINEQFKAKSSVNGEFSYIIEPEKKRPIVIDFEVLNNDDKILKTCLQISQVNEPLGSVTSLITNDINLASKAMNRKLPVYSWEELIRKMGVQLEDSDEEEQTVKAKKRRVSNSSKAEPKLISRTPITSSHTITPAQKSTTVASASSCKSSDSPSYAAYLALSYKSAAELRIVIEKHLRKEYDHLWNKMFKVDWDRFDMREAIRILKSGWMGTFSDIFKRDPQVRKLIDEMHDLMRFEQRNCEKLLAHLKRLMQSVSVQKVPPVASRSLPGEFQDEDQMVS